MDPNSGCDSWDQRIPNEYIFDRIFLITHAPIHKLTYPLPSSITHNILFSKTSEKLAASIWIDTCLPGLSITPHLYHNFSHLCQNHPHKPWLYGISQCTDVESFLRGINTSSCSHQHFFTDSHLNKLMQMQSAKMDSNGRLWNICTRL
jgi:hypothetical protein